MSVIVSDNLENKTNYNDMHSSVKVKLFTKWITNAKLSTLGTWINRDDVFTMKRQLCKIGSRNLHLKRIFTVWIKYKFLH